MFNLKVKLFLATSVLVLGGLSANAQIADNTSIKVNVPNAFTLKDETFTAGIYTIERTPTTADSPSLLIIRGENGDSMIFDTMVARSKGEAKSTQLVFDTVGSTNYLSGIVIQGQEVMNEIPKTKSQKKAIAEGSAVRNYLTITNTGF